MRTNEFNVERWDASEDVSPRVSIHTGPLFLKVALRVLCVREFQTERAQQLLNANECKINV